MPPSGSLKLDFPASYRRGLEAPYLGVLIGRLLAFWTVPTYSNQVYLDCGQAGFHLP